MSLERASRLQRKMRVGRRGACPNFQRDPETSSSQAEGGGVPDRVALSIVQGTRECDSLDTLKAHYLAREVLSVQTQHLCSDQDLFLCGPEEPPSDLMQVFQLGHAMAY